MGDKPNNIPDMKTLLSEVEKAIPSSRFGVAYPDIKNPTHPEPVHKEEPNETLSFTWDTEDEKYVLMFLGIVKPEPSHIKASVEKFGGWDQFFSIYRTITIRHYRDKSDEDHKRKLLTLVTSFFVLFSTEIDAATDNLFPNRARRDDDNHPKLFAEVLTKDQFELIVDYLLITNLDDNIPPLIDFHDDEVNKIMKFGSLALIIEAQILQDENPSYSSFKKKYLQLKKLMKLNKGIREPNIKGRISERVDDIIISIRRGGESTDSELLKQATEHLGAQEIIKRVIEISEQDNDIEMLIIFWKKLDTSHWKYLIPTIQQKLISISPEEFEALLKGNTKLNFFTGRIEETLPDALSIQSIIPRIKDFIRYHDNLSKQANRHTLTEAVSSNARSILVEKITLKMFQSFGKSIAQKPSINREELILIFRYCTNIDTREQAKTRLLRGAREIRNGRYEAIRKILEDL